MIILHLPIPPSVNAAYANNKSGKGRGRYRTNISPSVLKHLLRFEPETGKFYWVKRSPEYFQCSEKSLERICNGWNAQWVGKEALTAIGKTGYKYGKILGNDCYAHRVAWAITYGYWPNEIDHIDHNKGNNRIANLRNVNRAENQKNLPLRLSNTSGHTGVSWNKRRRKWVAFIQHRGKYKGLGYFTDKARAIAKRKEAISEYGYHKNHGGLV